MIDSTPNTPDSRIGILLVNLGTPEATSYWPMRAYLKEFLSDSRVIETNRALWWVILNGIILTFRPKKSGHAYARIWNRELDESPLKTFTRNQSEKLAAGFNDKAIMVDWVMRYGQPAIKQGLVRLKQAGCDRVLVFPLYPQYSATTTASVVDKVAEAMKTMRWQPTLRFVPPFYNDRRYIKALALRTKEHIARLAWQPDKVIVSYHGLPKDYVEKGDPYYQHCLATSKSLADELGWNESYLQTTFQSRVGRKEWLKPYTDKTVLEAAKSGTKNLLLISPAFISDCVETLEELSIGLAEEFTRAGGENFTVAPCLNDSDVSIDLLKAICEDELQGWL
jgi:ferrochelatase